MGMVLQETHLFEGSIKDNVRFENNKASEEDVIESVKLANSHKFITKFPEIYDTILYDNLFGL